MELSACIEGHTLKNAQIAAGKEIRLQGLAWSSFSMEWPVVLFMIRSSACFCSSTSRHLIWISMALALPRGRHSGLLQHCCKQTECPQSSTVLCICWPVLVGTLGCCGTDAPDASTLPNFKKVPLQKQSAGG